MVSKDSYMYIKHPLHKNCVTRIKLKQNNCMQGGAWSLYILNDHSNNTLVVVAKLAAMHLPFQMRWPTILKHGSCH